jgi:outer membrane protein assembly factor BamD
MPARLLVLALLASAFAGALGCTTQPQAALSAEEFQASAQAAYDHALKAFLDRDWVGSATRMETVKREYAGTRYARLAQLRIADGHFHQKDYPEAITAYREFLRDFPSDEEVPYARYKVIDCQFQARGESVMSPPLEERDLVNVREASQGIDAFLRDYPAYPERERILYMRTWVRGMLARYELYVARYYLRENHYDAALARTEYALVTYKDTGLEPEALVLLGETQMKKGDPAEARAAFELVLERYPSSPFAEPARRFLAWNLAASGARGKSGAPLPEANPEGPATRAREP